MTPTPTLMMMMTLMMKENHRQILHTPVNPSQLGGSKTCESQLLTRMTTRTTIPVPILTTTKEKTPTLPVLADPLV